jgi:ABC-type Fe3+-hydroxamate transport system substrate-binding protein
MNPTRRVVICGQSLFLMAIEAGLAGVPDIEVTRLDQPTLSRLTALAPSLIISERDNDEALVRTLVNRDLPLVQLDVSQSEVRVFSETSVQVAGIDDLIRLIGQLVTADHHDDGATIGEGSRQP